MPSEALSNLAEYEGFLEIEESTISELCALAKELIADVEKLTKAPLVAGMTPSSFY